MKIKAPVIAKTATYALVHMVISFCVAWFVSKSFLVALGISLIEPSIQIFAYYLHERAWMKWGKMHPSQAAPDWNVGGGCGHAHHDGHHKH